MAAPIGVLNSAHVMNHDIDLLFRLAAIIIIIDEQRAIITNNFQRAHCRERRSSWDTIRNMRYVSSQSQVAGQLLYKQREREEKNHEGTLCSG